MTRNCVNQCLARLEVVYPHHFKQSGNVKLALEVYHEILDDIDDSLLIATTKQWLSTARPFHPSPGELRDLSLTMITRNEPSADEAWSEVLEAIHKIGSYRTPEWSNERITKTIKAFGWFELCMTETDQLGIVRSQFMRIYEAQTKREQDDRLMLPETRARVDALIGATVKQLTTGAK
jgi:hypothetical protein